MVYSKLRRVLAAAVLASMVSLVSAGSADAAVRTRGHRQQSVASRVEGGAVRLRTLLVDALAKAGIRIDPNGLDGGH